MKGQDIIDEIIRQPMFRVECPSHPEAGCLIIWNGNAAEQLDAIVVVREIRGNFLPENPTHFDYLHAIRAVASRAGLKQIFDLADAGMNPPPPP